MLQLLLLATMAFSQSPRLALERGEIVPAPRYSLEQVLDAVRAVESGGMRDEGRSATGDGGRAIGPYQVHFAHWRDSRLTGRFEDCRDPGYARREVIAYWKHWCPDALERLDAEVLARVHNGGPLGARKAATLPFWSKVRAALERGSAAKREAARKR